MPNRSPSPQPFHWHLPPLILKFKFRDLKVDLVTGEVAILKQLYRHPKLHSKETTGPLTWLCCPGWPFGLSEALIADVCWHCHHDPSKSLSGLCTEADGPWVLGGLVLTEQRLTDGQGSVCCCHSRRSHAWLNAGISTPLSSQYHLWPGFLC